MDTSLAPYVSVIITGRNDGYGGDFAERLLATLHFNHRELAARGVPHEFVLVEWAPPAGMPLLADLVERHDPAAAGALRTVAVDAQYHEALSLNPRLRYHEFIAKNVGARRARGRYVITTNCDTFFGRRILDRLERRQLEPDIVYRAARYDLKADTDYQRITWGDLENPASLERPGPRLRPPHFGGGSGDFIMLDRASFERVRGFNEVYRVARVGIDRNFLIHALTSGLAIADIGGPVYHVSHEGSLRVTASQYTGREWEAPYGDSRWPQKLITYRNWPGWGLDLAPVQHLGPRRSRLVFSWRAVPPLVDLAGILTPARRRPSAAVEALTSHG